MSKRATSAAQKAQKVQSANWKEEVILKKQLDTLESLRRQVVSSITLDQRATYNRFRLKLQRSELASARLLGHGHGHCGSERHRDDRGAQTALNALLRRPVSAPARSSTPRPPSRVTTPSTPAAAAAESAQPLTACRRDDHRQQLLPALVVQSEKISGRNAKARPGTARSPSSRRWPRLVSSANVTGTDADALDRTVPRPQPAAGATRVKFSTTETPEGELGGRASASEKFKNATREHEATAPESSGIDETLAAASPRVKQKMPMSRTVGPESKASLQESGGGSVGAAMRVFLQNVKSTGTSPTEEALKWLRHRQDIEKEKLRAFTERLQPLQVTEEPGSDHETAWMHDTNPSRVRECVTLEPEEEDLSKWMVVGKEIHSRSLTFRAADDSLLQTELPAEMLFLECYNALLTRENWEERKWFNNDPNTLVK